MTDSPEPRDCGNCQRWECPTCYPERSERPPVDPLREALRAVLRDFDREPTEWYLNDAERIFRAALAEGGER